MTAVLGSITAKRQRSTQWRRALHEIVVDPDLSSAVVDGHRLTAEDPRQLHSQLSVAIYDHLHAGRGPEIAGRPRRVRDAVYERALTDVVPHRHSAVRATIRRLPSTGQQPAAPAGALLVEHASLRLWVRPEDVETPADQWALGAAVLVRVSAHRPALSPGFFLVDGVRSIPHDGGELLRVYVHLGRPADAIRAWRTVLEHLEGRHVVYRAKVLSATRLYPRRDSLVVYLPRESWIQLEPLCTVIGELSGLLDETSQFTGRFASGAALAFEPRDQNPARRGLSFGQHRAMVAAGALIDSATKTTDLDDELDRHCADANIDPVDPARNLSSRTLSDLPALFE